MDWLAYFKKLLLHFHSSWNVSCPSSRRPAQGGGWGLEGTLHWLVTLHFCLWPCHISRIPLLCFWIFIHWATGMKLQNRTFLCTSFSLWMWDTHLLHSHLPKSLSRCLFLNAWTQVRVCLTLPDAPRPPTVSTNPSHNILEGVRVTLTCQSDANPPASYRWFNRHHTLYQSQPELVIQSVRSSDSRQYYCRAENLLGESTNHIWIDVECEELNCVQMSYLIKEF